MPRNVLTVLLAVLTLAVEHSARAQTLEARRVAGGFVLPVWTGAPAGDLHRVFVIEQEGRVRIVRDGVVLATPFLDLVPEVNSATREQGLLSLAFHPRFASNGKYYACFTDLNSSIVVREYVAGPNPLDDDVSSTSGARDVVGPIRKPTPGHNGGCLQFGPDGMLYLSTGDGGGGYDVGPGHDPAIGNAQSLQSLFGKILRVDVDAGPPYDPGDNPWSSDTDGVDDLIWSIGLRNPWRFAFDAANGDLYVGDVGQNTWEELDWLPHALGFGANFGWRCQEGLHCTGFAGCTCNVPPGTNPALVDPVIEYEHVNGKCAVMGGVVYRGTAIPWLSGAYFYAEYCTHRIFTCAIASGVVTNHVDRTAELDPFGADTIGFVTSFGVDGSGEVLLCDYVDGEIYRVGEACPASSTYCVGAPNSVGPGARIAATGSSYVSRDDFGLAVAGLPPSTFGFFVTGTGRTQLPLGDGFLCIASNHVRLGIAQASSTGVATRAIHASTFPGALDPGEVWSFQFHYRNVAAGGAGSNLSDAIEVPFCR